MKKMIAITAILVVASVVAFAGCKKETAPKPAAQSSETTTVPPAKKAPQGC